MADLQFTCNSCGRPLSLGREFSGAHVECPKCRRLTEVPGPRMGSVRGLNPDGELPPEILGIEIKFLCKHCETKLMIDYRWQARTVDCPGCNRLIQVPRCSFPELAAGAASGDEQGTGSRLSAEELAFLSAIPATSS